MEKAVEFDLNMKEFKEYIEECLKEDNIKYEIKIEDRWIQNYREASKFYQVYCIYVNNNDLDKVKKYKTDFDNGTIITDDIEEFKNVEEENDSRYKSFTKKKFLKYYFIFFIIFALIIILGSKFAS